MLGTVNVVPPGQEYSLRQGDCLTPRVCDRPFHWPGKGGWVVLTGSRIIFAMIINSLRVSNNTSSCSAQRKQSQELREYKSALFNGNIFEI